MFTSAHASNLALRYIPFVVWLQAIGKIGNKMMQHGKLGISLFAQYLNLVNRKIHCWRSDNLTGCIWNLLAHILLPLATGVPWGFLTLKMLFVA